MKNEVKYVHDIAVHNQTAPRNVVPVIINLFQPYSVLDVGCGIGTWLSVFKENNVNAIFGVDGDYVDKSMLLQYIQSDQFKAQDLSLVFNLGKKFDLLICLEVAEHISPEFAGVFISNLVNHSDLIVFGAAVPNQWGQNHLNEQWPEYWIDHFDKHGYLCYDIIRPLIWDNLNVEWWYKQNMLVFSKNPIKDYLPTNTFVSIIHPEHFNQKIERVKDLEMRLTQKTNDLEKWENGQKGIRKHCKVFLSSLKRKFFGTKFFLIC